MTTLPDWYMPEDAAPAASQAGAAPAQVPDWYAPEPGAAQAAAAAPAQPSDGVGGYLQSIPGRLANWYQNAAEYSSPDGLDAAYTQSTGQAPDYSSMAGVRSVVNNPAVNEHVMSSALMGMTDGGIRAPLAKGAPLSLPAGLATDATVAKANTAAQQFPQTRLGQFQGPAQTAADAIGPAASPVDIGGLIKQRAQDFVAQQKTNLGNAYKAIEAQFPADYRAPMNNTLDLLTKPNEGPPLDAPIAGQIAARLNQNRTKGLGETLPYPALKQWRTEVGDAIDAGDGQHAGALKQLYGALSKDMEGAISTQSGDAGVAAFNSANNRYGTAMDLIHGVVGNVADKALTPESVYSKLVASPANSATQLRDLFDFGVLRPEDAPVVARSAFDNLSKNAQGHYDPTKVAAGVGDLATQNPVAAAVLFGQPGQQAALRSVQPQATALANTVNGMGKITQEGIPVVDRVVGSGKQLLGSALGSSLPVVGHMGGELLGLRALEAHAPQGNPLMQVPRGSIWDLLRRHPTLGNSARAYLNAIGQLQAKPQQQ